MTEAVFILLSPIRFLYVTKSPPPPYARSVHKILSSRPKANDLGFAPEGRQDFSDAESEIGDYVSRRTIWVTIPNALTGRFTQFDDENSRQELLAFPCVVDAGYPAHWKDNNGLRPKMERKMSQPLLDRIALHDLVMRYCRGCDRRDFALVRTLYHDDAIDDHGTMFQGGPDAFVAWLPEITAHWDLTRHNITNSLFVIDGDHAEGEHYVEAWHRTHGPGAKLFIALGRYLDRYERRDGLWKFTYRSLVFDHGSIVPVDEGAFERMSQDAPNGRADREDPSFRYPLLAGLSA